MNLFGTMLATLLLAALSAMPAAADVKLTVAETAGVDRTAEPVTTGVPLAKGIVKDLAGLAITRGGKAVPAQFRAISNWPDGSIRWVLVDFQADVKADAKADFVLTTDGAANPAPAKPVEVADAADRISVDSGAVQFAVDKKGFNLLGALSVNGQAAVAAGDGVRLLPGSGAAIALGAKAPDKVEVAEAGPMRAVIHVTGKFGDANKGMIEYIAYITAWSGEPMVKVRFWLRNLGGYGYNNRRIGWNEWFTFDGLSLDLDLSPLLGGGVAGVSCEGETASVAAGGKWQVAQYGEHPSYKSMKYEITADGRSAKSGQHTDGVTRVSAGGRSLTVTVKDFWQNYEKAIELEGGKLHVWLWPTFGEWPRSDSSRGRSGDGRRAKGLYVLPGSTQKGHEVLLDFRTGLTPQQSAATTNQPLMAMADASWYSDTEAFGLFAPGSFAPPDAKAAAAVASQDQWVRNSLDPSARLSMGQSEQIGRFGFWLGMMDFGDMCWDSGRGSGPCTLHYDWTWIATLNYLRQGQRYFFDAAGRMAQHLTDIDQRWSDRDYPVYRGLTAFEMNAADIHGGSNDGHNSPIPSHNWIRGRVFYYLLTGDPMVLEGVRRNADVGLYERLVEPMTKEPEKNVDRQTRESGWAIECLMSMYDLTADAKYLDWARTLWKNHLRPRWKEHGPSFYAGDRLGLQMFYCTTGLIMLHHDTQDPELLDYMEDVVKACDAHPDKWDYADELAIFTSNYWGYLAVMKNKPEYLTKAREYYEKRIPSNAGQLVLLSGTRAFTKEVGKSLRNGHVWLWAERHFRKD
ncbi:MAG: hypothetical protein BIFFINMI_01381 [Phycisphaerae bacterium]|nr:hypothetical protein [Phycisphaerae bacterium]